MEEQKDLGLYSEDGAANSVSVPSTIELKPCPFCGGVGHVDDTSRDHSVECGTCGAIPRYKHLHEDVSRSEAIKAWNRRPPSPNPLPTTEGVTQGWQDIATAPKDEQYYLMIRGKVPMVATWDEQDECWFTFNGWYERQFKKTYDPTHWQPLPPPPGQTETP